MGQTCQWLKLPVGGGRGVDGYFLNIGGEIEKGVQLQEGGVKCIFSKKKEVKSKQFPFKVLPTSKIEEGHFRRIAKFFT